MLCAPEFEILWPKLLLIMSMHLPSFPTTYGHNNCCITLHIICTLCRKKMVQFYDHNMRTRHFDQFVWFFTPFKCKIKFEQIHIYMWTGHIYMCLKNHKFIECVLVGTQIKQSWYSNTWQLSNTQYVIVWPVASNPQEGVLWIVAPTPIGHAQGYFCTIWIPQELIGLHTVWAETHQRQHQHSLTSPHI